MQRKRQKKSKQLSTVFLIRMSSAVVAIAKYNNKTRTQVQKLHRALSEMTGQISSEH